MSRNKVTKWLDYAMVAVAVVLTTGVLLGVLSCAAHAQELGPPPLGPPPVVCAVVTYGPPLNLRVVPNGPVLAWLLPGDQILIDGADGRWAHVTGVARFDVIPGLHTLGWVFGPYLVPCQI